MHRCRKLSALALAALSSLVLAAPAMAFTYPAAVQKAFVHSCVKGGGSTRTCECVIKYVEQRESLKTFDAQALHYKGRLPAIEKQAIRACS